MSEYKPYIPKRDKDCWSDMWTVFLCECGEHISVEVDDEPRTCRKCGRIYNVQTRVFMKEKNDV